MNKLYVGNLDYSVTGDQLGELFSKAGLKVASATVITDRQTGRSKGFGFVEMENAEDAEKAIAMFNNQEVKDLPGERKLVVNPARPREPRNY